MGIRVTANVVQGLKVKHIPIMLKLDQGLNVQPCVFLSSRGNYMRENYMRDSYSDSLVRDNASFMG